MCIYLTTAVLKQAGRGLRSQGAAVPRLIAAPAVLC